MSRPFLRLISRCSPLAALALAAALSASPSGAQQTPIDDKPVRIEVPYASGGIADTQARMMAARLQQRWGRTVLVENRAGGNTVVATAFVAKAPADCSTLLLGTLATVLNELFYAKLPYDRKQDLAEVSLVTRVPNVLVVPLNSQFSDLQSLVAYGRAHPDQLSFASTGNGGASHLSGELLATMGGMKMIHVPYSGGAAAQRDLLPGRVDLMFDSSSIPNIQAGRVRALAIPTAQRSKLLPDVPTTAEAGFKDLISVTWFGFYTPSNHGATPACLPSLARDVIEVAHEPEFVSRLAELGAEAVGSTPQEMAKFEDEEMSRWKAVIDRGNIRLAN